jgi:hypothetical protein
MDNAIVNLTPAEEVLVPIDKIVRCRYRDVENLKEKIADNVKRIGEQGFRYPLQGMRLNTVEKLIEYLMVLDRETYSNPKLAEAKAKTMPLDLIEQWVGHNRVGSCLELGTWYIWGKEHLGKGTLIPFLLRDEPKEEIRRIFLSDNMKWDTQSCGWAIGAIRTIVPDMMAAGVCKSEAYAYVAGECGLDLEDIEVLAEADEAMDHGVMSLAIKRLTPANGVLFWVTLKAFLVLSPMSIAQQDKIVDQSFKARDQRRSITNQFSDIRNALPKLPKPVVTKQKKSPDDAVLQHLYKALTLLQSEELRDDTKLRITEYAGLITQLSATAPSQADIEADELIAAIEAEAAQENYDTTASN